MVRGACDSACLAAITMHSLYGMHACGAFNTAPSSPPPTVSSTAKEVRVVARTLFATWAPVCRATANHWMNHALSYPKEQVTAYHTHGEGSYKSRRSSISQIPHHHIILETSSIPQSVWGSPRGLVWGLRLALHGADTWECGDGAIRAPGPQHCACRHGACTTRTFLNLQPSIDVHGNGHSLLFLFRLPSARLGHFRGVV